MFDPDLNSSTPFTSPIIECANTFEIPEKIPDLTDKVAEFNYDKNANKWVFVRLRDDKGENARGNSLKVARNILANILYNIDFQLLCEGTGDLYFEHKRTVEYRAMTKFINDVK